MAKTKKHTDCPCQPVGLTEIAEIAGLKQQTMQFYNTVGKVPQPRWYVGNRPVWCLEQDIRPWLKERAERAAEREAERVARAAG